MELDQPITVEGMAEVVQTAVTLRLITEYKPDNAKVWFAALDSSARRRNMPLPTFRTVIGALFAVSDTRPTWFQPSDIWHQIWVLADQRVKAALAQWAPPLPVLATFKEERAWESTWRQAVVRGLDRDQAADYADRAHNVTRTTHQLTHMPQEIRERLTELFKES